jgi:hypothetical protein
VFGNVDTKIIGRPYTSIAMHPHEEFVIIELVLQHTETTLTEILNEVYIETGSEYACSTIFYYLKQNNMTRKKVGVLFAYQLDFIVIFILYAGMHKLQN